jgi:hypothetical protein
MDKTRKLELIQRSLGLKHKLKVQEATTPPQTHEDLSAMMLARWELEDEIRAIEELLARTRGEAVSKKVKELLAEDESGAGKRMQAKAKKKGGR